MQLVIKLRDALYSENGILLIVIALVGIFAFYAFQLIITEFQERKLYSLLYKKVDIEEYLKEISEFIARSRKVSKIAKYSTYKAIGLYYKGDNERALEWLKKVSKDIQNVEEIEVKYLYAAIMLKIVFRLGYNEQIEGIYKEYEPMIQKMLLDPGHKYEAEYLIALHDYKCGNYKQAYSKFTDLKKVPYSKLEKAMISYQLAKTCLELDKIEEAEREVEEVMYFKSKTRTYLFIYDELQRIIKERRNSNNTISTVDRDLEEEKQKEALVKLQKEVEDAINEEASVLKQKATEMLNEEDALSSVESGSRQMKEDTEDSESQINAEFEMQRRQMLEQMKVQGKIDGN